MMYTLPVVLKIALAAFMTTYMLMYIGGPFYVFERLRSSLGIEVHIISSEKSDEIEVYYPSRFVPQLFSCPICLGFWNVLVMFIVHMYIPVFIDIFAALAILSIIMGSVYGKGN